MRDYFKDDIVEIITSDSKDYRDAIRNNKFTDGYNYIPDFIGQRFIITSVIKFEHYRYLTIFGAGIQKKDYEVRLYRRPFKNYIQVAIKIIGLKAEN